MEIGSPLSRIRKRWKYMDSNLKTVIVWGSGLLLVTLVLIMASSLVFGPGPVELESPSLSTEMECTDETACSVAVTVNSTGSAEGIAVAYTAEGDNSSSTIDLGEGESATVETRSTVAVYGRHDGTSRLHSTYQPPSNASGNESLANAPRVGVRYDQSPDADGTGTNVTVTLTAIDGADSITVEGEDESRTLRLDESTAFQDLTSDSSLTVKSEYDGTGGVLQKYTLLDSSTDSDSGPRAGK